MFRSLFRRGFSDSVSAASAVESTNANKFFKVKLYRGFIGLPKVYQEWARTLGLRKRGQTSYVPVMPQTMGAIIKLKELLMVDLVDEKPDSTKIIYPKGYEVIDNYLNKPLVEDGK